MLVITVLVLATVVQNNGSTLMGVTSCSMTGPAFSFHGVEILADQDLLRSSLDKAIASMDEFRHGNADLNTAEIKAVSHYGSGHTQMKREFTSNPVFETASEAVAFHILSPMEPKIYRPMGALWLCDYVGDRDDYENAEFEVTESFELDGARYDRVSFHDGNNIERRYWMTPRG